MSLVLSAANQGAKNFSLSLTAIAQGLPAKACAFQLLEPTTPSQWVEDRESLAAALLLLIQILTLDL